MNAHYTPMAASAESKNLLETERNILLPRFHDPSAGGVLMNGLTDLFGTYMRDKDKKDRAKSIIGQSTLHIPVVKSSKDARLGLGIKKVEEGTSLEVISIDPGSLFESSALKVGMIIQSVNKIPFTSFDQGLALLKGAKGACEIMVFNPLEMSDDDQALVKWYKDDLAYHKDYQNRGKKPVEIDSRVKVTSEGDRVWIVKSINEEGKYELRDEYDKETIFVAKKFARCIS